MATRATCPWIIQSNWRTIVEKLTCHSNICDHLHQERHLTQEESQKIQIQGTDEAKTRKLLTLLSRKPDKAYDKFREVLLKTGQKDIVDYLDSTVQTELEVHHGSYDSNTILSRHEDKDQVRTLLNLLEEKSAQVYQRFMAALNDSNQEEILTQLTSDLKQKDYESFNRISDTTADSAPASHTHTVGVTMAESVPKFENKPSISFNDCDWLLCISCSGRDMLVLGKTNAGKDSLAVHDLNGKLKQKILSKNKSIFDVACRENVVYLYCWRTGSIDIYNKTNGSWQDSIVMSTDGENGICIKDDFLYMTSQKECSMYQIDLSNNNAIEEMKLDNQVRPCQVACNGKIVVISCSDNHKVYAFETPSTILFEYGGKLSWPRGVCVDAQGNIMIADYGNNRVVFLTSSGQFAGEVGVKHPMSLAVNDNDDGILYITTNMSKELTIWKYK